MTPSLDSDLILIVDDNPNNLEVLSEALADTGFEVAIATSGEAALQQLKYTPVSLILLDVMMPGIDGFETCQRIRSNFSTKDIPVIFITALADSEDKVKGLRLGAVDYITKPFRQEEVIVRIRTHLQLQHLTKTLAIQNQQLQTLNWELEQKVAERTDELSASLQRLKQTQLQLIQSEKMSAIGNLVASVAHEINNPVGFLMGNLQPAHEYINDLLRLIDLYQQKYPYPDTEIADEIRAIELDYLREDLPKLLNSMSLGIDRIKNISISLCNFSRADLDYKVSYNIHEGIDSTILMLKHRLKANEQRPDIEVITEYGELPLIMCFPGQLNQVFMNILVNAIDALEESNTGRNFEDIKSKPNQIRIQTELSQNCCSAEKHQQVLIRIADNGVGMSEEIKQHIFDYLFTTKEIGKGTGLGLAITHQIIVEKHSGTIKVDSFPDQGTEFLITLPV